VRRRRTTDREDRERVWQEIGIKLDPGLVRMLSYQHGGRAGRRGKDDDGGDGGGIEGKRDSNGMSSSSSTPWRPLPSNSTSASTSAAASATDATDVSVLPDADHEEAGIAAAVAEADAATNEDVVVTRTRRPDRKRRLQSRPLFSAKTGKRVGISAKQSEKLHIEGMANAVLVAGVKEVWQEFVNEHPRKGLEGSLNESAFVTAAILLDELLNHELEL